MPNQDEAPTEWQRKVYKYTSAVNAFVERGLREGWEKAGAEPKAPSLKRLVPLALDAVRKANRTGKLEKLRDRWPPAHHPLIPLLGKNGQSIPTLCLLDDLTVLARIGAEYEKGRVVHIAGESVTEVPGIEYFGRSPNRRYFAIARRGGVSMTDGWQGAEVTFCPWPTGKEDVPARYDVQPLDDLPRPKQLIPFPDGRRVLLVSNEGIFVLSSKEARRILPTKEDLRVFFEWLRKEYPGDELTISLDMAHGAVSPNGKLIAAGCQDSKHLVFNARLKLIGEIGHQSEYPHYAVFSSKGGMIAFNSCHFYNGVTVGVRTKLLPGLTTESYQEDERTPILEDESRVYAAVHRADEFIIGNAGGYILAFSEKSEPRWRHFIGSSIGAIDISPDGKTLVVSTYAGFISIIRLDAGQQAPYQIGNGNHLELRRWLFWKKEPRPLIW
jgi:hypothetical protein